MMRVRRTTAGVEVQTPAKLNLFFEVLAKRRDGYHEIETLQAPLAIYDTLVLADEPGGEVVAECRWAGGLEASDGEALGDLPGAHENLAVRALDLLRQRSGVAKGARMKLVKRIPSAAGLGGASSDAAATLVAGNALWELGLSLGELGAIAGELGSDVPFFLAGGAAVCRGRGERVEPVGPLPVLHAVVVKPPDSLSTAAVYARCKAAEAPQPVERVVNAWKKGDLSRLCSLLANRLEPAAAELSPWMMRVRRALAESSAMGFGMTGSGSSWFGICRSARNARRLARDLAGRRVGYVTCGAVSAC
jgi:4-diphosphocytidyl-2-C-methyl-D-erythritol kinase